MIKASCQFYNPGMSFSEIWKLFLQNVVMKEESTPTPQLLWECRSLTLSGTLIQIIKLSPVVKIGETLLLKVLPNLHIENFISVFGDQC